MSPGTYLAKRRAAAGLSLEDVAARIGSDPKISERDRIAWLKLIECDAVPVGDPIVTALLPVFGFDIELLYLLIANTGVKLNAVPPMCRVCACSDLDRCPPPADPCSWADATQTLCTTCAARPPAVSVDEGETQ